MYADEFNDEPSPFRTTSGLTPPPSSGPKRHYQAGRRWIATGAAVVTLALVGVGASSLPVGAPLWNLSTTTVQAQTTTDPQTAAIQQVLQRANDEQVQAITSGDPSVMSDTATSAHYQELVQINQDLTSNGVIAITLPKLDFGPFPVNGAAATATTYETWG